MSTSEDSPNHRRSTLRILLVGSGEDAEWAKAMLASSSAWDFEVSHVPEFLDPSTQVESVDADAMLLLISQGVSDPLGPLTQTVARAPDLPIVLISNIDDEGLALEALQSGARGYLVRAEAGPLQLVTTLATALESHSTSVKLREARTRAIHLATHDQVTNLENRSSFRNRLAGAVGAAERSRRKLAVLFADVDGLRTINETLGHGVGDRLLREAAERMLATVRASDAVGLSDLEPSDGAISRMGGGEFTVLLTEISEPRDAARVARRILDVVSRPFRIDGRELFASAGVGIAVYPFDGEVPEDLLRHANAAMVQAKARERSSFRFFSRSMNADTARKLELGNALHRALERQELSLHYQPVRDATSGRLIGAEALLRWNSAESGSVSPGEFIPIAEETGLILPIGEWVLRTACKQSEEWRTAGLQLFWLAVNLSVHQLKQATLAETVMRILEETGMSPAQLELEITESALLEKEGATMASLRALHDMGIGFALDDFGTGYSALSYLGHLPINRLKIDSSFIGEIATNPDDSAVAAAVIAMAHTLKLRVVAEGVETLEQAELLRQHGCDEFQGFLLGPPVPVAEFTRFLEREKGTPAD